MLHQTHQRLAYDKILKHGVEAGHARPGYLWKAISSRTQHCSWEIEFADLWKKKKKKKKLAFLNHKIETEVKSYQCNETAARIMTIKQASI